MRIQNPISIFASTVALAVCLGASTVLAQESKIETVAAVTAYGSEVRWQPQVEYGRLVLTIATPGGEVLRKEFEAGTIPTFKLTDSKGSNLAEGSYTYELRVVPNLSLEVRKALAASREKGNTEEIIQELQRNSQLPTKIVVQSGTFLLENGAVLTGSPESGAEPRTGKQISGSQIQSKKKSSGQVTIEDVVTPDDIIVQGSACIGLDCVNNENFGFDTIRLKENNTRIKFDDTSTAAGFPANDWQLTANDSASGGSNKFSIEDITGAKVPFTITAGAPTNSLFVSSTGRVGLRTSTPVLDVHVATGDTPAHRLEQNASSGFTAQTWDIAGNEANFFVRDVTGGSRLPFRIRPGAPTSSIDISATGNVGIGTSSPSFKLDVFSSSAISARVKSPDVAFRLEGNKAAGNNWALQTVDADGRFRVFDDTSGAERVTVLQNGNLGVGTATPAGRLDVNGSIFQRGIQLFADYVFEPAYTLESIDEHSAFMWNNKHLPAVGARTVDEKGQEVVEIGARMRGMLEELEKAHIYISTLSDKITEKEAALARLERQNTELAERLARIEAALSASKTPGSSNH